MKFTDFEQSKMGTLGEDLVDDIWEEVGFSSYSPVKTDVSHVFDRIVVDADGQTVFKVDIKTKEARINYPDTGIDIKLYNIYKNIKGIFILLFVDPKLGKIYGSSLDELDKPRTLLLSNGDIKHYPSVEGGKRYWLIKHMTTFSDFSEEVASEIKSHGTANPKYRTDLYRK